LPTRCADQGIEYRDEDFDSRVRDITRGVGANVIFNRRMKHEIVHAWELDQCHGALATVVVVGDVVGKVAVVFGDEAPRLDRSSGTERRTGEWPPSRVAVRFSPCQESLRALFRAMANPEGALLESSASGLCVSG
jgi:NADPH:quinone reductase-like Zn-dependent oxidoreductase